MGMKILIVFLSQETRGHEIKLLKDQCRLDIRKYSFSQRTINEWNKLSTDCITASSVNITGLTHISGGHLAWMATLVKSCSIKLHVND